MNNNLSFKIEIPEEQIRTIVKEELAKIIASAGNSMNAISGSQSKKHIRGIKGLAEFMNCTPKTAQQYKNSGKIPYTQIGRIVLFDPEKVLEAMQQSNKPRKR